MARCTIAIARPGAELFAEMPLVPLAERRVVEARGVDRDGVPVVKALERVGWRPRTLGLQARDRLLGCR